MNQVRVFVDSCVLIEGVCAPWSASRGVLILGRSAMFRFLLAEAVVKETERAFAKKLGDSFGSVRSSNEEFRFLLSRLNVEHISHASNQEFLRAQPLIPHWNDVPVLAAAIRAKPDWLLTDNTSHFDDRVSQKTGLRIATPTDFLAWCGKLF